MKFAANLLLESHLISHKCSSNIVIAANPSGTKWAIILEMTQFANHFLKLLFWAES